MRFIDEVKVRVSGGHGGPGCVSFRREKFAEFGGPDGGEGGMGGDVIFRASTQLSTLQDLRYRREYKAQAGLHGQGSGKAGKDGVTIEVKVPVGTQVFNEETGDLIVDFEIEGQEWIAARGGRGGKGNSFFVTSRYQAPKFAQPGEEGETRELRIELKLLADVGIIGYPNAGKSTLISRISAAKPKIADYAFTTLVPNLGVVERPDFTSFVVADIPGLIEGAHRGLGLGHRFLKHVERTRVFVHVLDAAKILRDSENEALVRAESNDIFIESTLRRYHAIRNELKLFNESMCSKPEILIVNKCDLLESKPDLLTTLNKTLNALRVTEPQLREIFFVSAVSGHGIDNMIYGIERELRVFKETIQYTPATSEISETSMTSLDGSPEHLSGVASGNSSEGSDADTKTSTKLPIGPFRKVLMPFEVLARERAMKKEAFDRAKVRARK